MTDFSLIQLGVLSKLLGDKLPLYLSVAQTSGNWNTFSWNSLQGLWQSSLWNLFICLAGITLIFRSSLLEVFCKKSVLKRFAKFTGKQVGVGFVLTQENNMLEVATVHFLFIWWITLFKHLNSLICKFTRFCFYEQLLISASVA